VVESTVSIIVMATAAWAAQCRMKDRIADLIELRGTRAHTDSWDLSQMTVEN
jgi:hypothetical protein